MARVTVEDCLLHVENRFDLVIKAAERAHLLELGAADPMVDVDNDKPTVIALREIAAGLDITQKRATAQERAEDQAPIENFEPPRPSEYTGLFDQDLTFKDQNKE